MTDAAHPDDLPRVVAAFAQSITTGTPYDIEHRCRRSDGAYRWFQVRALPVQEAGGAHRGLATSSSLISKSGNWPRRRCVPMSAT